MTEQDIKFMQAALAEHLWDNPNMSADDIIQAMTIRFGTIAVQALRKHMKAA